MAVVAVAAVAAAEELLKKVSGIDIIKNRDATSTTSSTIGNTNRQYRTELTLGFGSCI